MLPFKYVFINEKLLQLFSIFCVFMKKTGLASKKNAACQIRQDSNDAIITPITTASVVFCVNDKTADKELVFSLDRK